MAIRFAAAIIFLVLISPAMGAPIQSPAPQKTARVLIEGEPVMIELLTHELGVTSARLGRTINLVEKDGRSYDWRILLTSGAGTDSGSCDVSYHCSTTSDCSSMSRSCTVNITVYFVGAVVLTPDGDNQYTETATGRNWVEARKKLARKLINRLF
jgi:hypothetical protein